MARHSELTRAGNTAATISRMKERALVLQLGRGLYQLPDASFDVNHELVEAAKLVPKGMERPSALSRSHDGQRVIAHAADLRRKR